MYKILAIVLIILMDMSLTIVHADANSISTLLQGYSRDARKEDSGFKEFSVERGRTLYEGRGRAQGNLLSCASCHGMDPRSQGKTRAGKVIEAMAPAINPSRFTDAKKVEKWFLRNCDDVLKRNCTSIEKGDFITYLLSQK